MHSYEPHMPDDRSYFEARAEQELSLAQEARHPAAVKSHYILAGLYLDRIYGPDVASPAGGEPAGLG